MTPSDLGASLASVAPRPPSTRPKACTSGLNSRSLVRACVRVSGIHAHTCMHIHAYTYTHAHTCIHIHTYIHTLTHTHTHTHALTHAYTYTHTHTHTHTLTHTCIHTHTRKHAHTHTHTRTGEVASFRAGRHIAQSWCRQTHALQ